MSYKVREYRLSPLAESDLGDIWLYTCENWSMEQADSYHCDIVTALEGLASGTKIGHRVEIRERYFSYAVGAHLVFYRQSDVSLDIIRILHHRMDVSRHL